MIACYPDNKADADILSSLHTPSGVTVYPVLYPETVGLAVAKIMVVGDQDTRTAVCVYLRDLKQEIEEADRRLRNGR